MKLRLEERGQATPLLIAVVGLIVVVFCLVAKVGSAVVGTSAVQTAADAAALAGATSGKAAAIKTAEANGARLQYYLEQGETVLVEVKSGDFKATAKAESGPGELEERFSG